MSFVTVAESLHHAPQFILPDSAGKPVALDDLLGHGPLVVVFYRGHWCPYCRRYLAKLQGNLRQITEHGSALVAISPEPPATVARLASDLGITFPLLCDVTGDVIDRFGTRNRLTGTRTILPHASVFILDREGAIRFGRIDRNYKRRTTMHTLFKQLAELKGNAGHQSTRISTNLHE